MPKPLRIGIVAGEASGDLLGAGLISAIKLRHPDAQFEGIAGPEMIAAGAQSRFPMERLSVMGIVEVLGRYRELLGVRRQLVKHFIANPPDVFIGIDAPDFNLGLERRLRGAGIRTVHYVSPSVWAWRQRRVKSIARAVDLMLCLFPFEESFYRHHRVPVCYVGHPLADTVPPEVNKSTARRALSLSETGEVLALLPGSRSNELHYLGPTFIATAQWLRLRRPDLTVVVPLANPARRTQWEKLLADTRDPPPMILVDGQSRMVMAAADVVLLASGTAALEAMLLKRPMVVSYKVAPLTAWIARRLLKVKNLSLPNILANETLVPERLQEEATPEALGQAVLGLLDNPAALQRVVQRFQDIHLSLRCDASSRAAEAVLALLKKRDGKVRMKAVAGQ